MIGGTITKLGVVLVVAGALLMAGPAFGFSSLAADRGVSVSTGPQDSALLSIDVEEYDDAPSLTNKNDETATVKIAEITNNLPETVEITDITVSGDTDVESAVRIATPDTGDNVDPGSIESVYVECRSDERLDERDVSFRVSVSGPSVTISGVVATESVEIDIRCNQGQGPGPDPDPDPDGEFSYSSEPERGDNNNDVIFEIQNDADGEISITGFEVRDAGSANSFESYRLNPPNTATITGNAEYSIGEQIEHESYTIDTDETVAYTIESFDRNNMNNQNFEFVLIDADGNEHVLPAVNIRN